MYLDNYISDTFEKEKRKLKNFLLTNVRKCDTIHVQSNDGNERRTATAKAIARLLDIPTRTKVKNQEVNRMDGDGNKAL